MDKITGRAVDIVAFLMEQADKDALFDLTPHIEKRKRTLTQNAYYWQLLEKMAVAQKISKAEIHNINLRHLGLTLKVADNPVYILLPDTEEVEKQTLIAETYHLAPRRETKVGKDGKIYRWYVMLKGSHDMTTQEMAALLDLAIQDAKAIGGIDLLTPRELEELREYEEKHHNRR